MESPGYIYLDNNKLNIFINFDMPEKASHVSGLVYYDNFLWAADYDSNKIYKIDIKKSILAGTS